MQLSQKSHLPGLDLGVVCSPIEHDTGCALECEYFSQCCLSKDPSVSRIPYTPCLMNTNVGIVAVTSLQSLQSGTVNSCDKSEDLSHNSGKPLCPGATL